MSTTTERTGADLVADALAEYGVRHVFGNPGTTELPFIEAVAERDACEYVMALQEDVAVGMAAGYAKTRVYHSHRDSGVCPVGVVNLHAAPGVAHGLGNVHGASYAGAPLVVTAGIQRTDFQHEEPMLSGDLVEMTQQFTKWSAMVDHVNALPTMLRRAFRVAMTPPTGPVFLGFPLDVLQGTTGADVEPLGEIPDAGEGDPEQLSRATDLLVEATRPVLVLGDAVARAGATDAAVSLAEATGARVHSEILAAEVNFPTDHPQWHSFLPPDEEVARDHFDADTLVFVGCSLNTTITAFETPLVSADTTCVHVHDDPWELGKNFRADAAVLGDPGRVLDALADGVETSLADDELARRMRAATDDEACRDGATTDTGDGILTKPELVDALTAVAPDALVVDESVTTKYVLLDRRPFSPEELLTTKGGGLGYGLPSLIGAAIAERQRPAPRNVVGLVGDGAFLYYPQTLYTAVRYGVDCTVVVPDNQGYTVLKRNTRDMLGDGEFDFGAMGIDLEPAVDIPGMADSQGVDASRVDDRDALRPALESALARDGPSLVDVGIRD